MSWLDRLRGGFAKTAEKVADNLGGITSRAALDRSLRGFMHFYNFDRPHHGYRVRGRTPAAVFHGAMATR